MNSKTDFVTAAQAAIADYPTAAALYQVQDPRLLAMLNAMATMLALKSADNDVAYNEPFLKTRDVTVLADAAIKGVLPFGTPTVVSLAVENATDTAMPIASGRRLLDSTGRMYVVTIGATVAANGTGTIKAKQQADREIAHTVSNTAPFYTIPVPASDSNQYLSDVAMRDSLGNVFTRSVEFANAGVGERIFHLSVDENRDMAVMFGATDIVGYQPAAAEAFTVTVSETEGLIELSAGTPFALEYTQSTAERAAKFTLASIDVPGANPMDISTLREVCSFPSIYDSSAVHLGNFDFLIRRNIQNLRFLSVWNEQVEETVRGASVDNMNCLFFAALADNVDQAALNSQITTIVRRADDSYRLRPVSVAHQPITLSIVGEVDPVHDFAVVRQSMIELVLAEYGPDSSFAKRGQGRVRQKRIHQLFRENILAFQDSKSDVIVTVNDVDTILPESYRYVSAQSLSVSVIQADDES